MQVLSYMYLHFLSVHVHTGFVVHVNAGFVVHVHAGFGITSEYSHRFCDIYAYALLEV